MTAVPAVLSNKKRKIKDKSKKIKVKNEKKVFSVSLCLVCCSCSVFTIPSAPGEPTGSSRGSGGKE